MVLMYGCSPKGAETIGTRSADTRDVRHVTFKPDWMEHAKAAPFKANVQILTVMLMSVIVFLRTALRTILPTRSVNSIFRSIGSNQRAHKAPSPQSFPDGSGPVQRASIRS